MEVANHLERPERVVVHLRNYAGGPDEALSTAERASRTRSCHCENRLLRSAAALDAGELRAEVGVFLSGGRPSGLDEVGFEPATPPGLCGNRLAGALVDSRGETYPAEQVAHGGKTAHVIPDLGDDDPCHGVAHAGNRDQEFASSSANQVASLTSLLRPGMLNRPGSPFGVLVGLRVRLSYGLFRTKNEPTSVPTRAHSTVFHASGSPSGDGTTELRAIR